MPSTADSQRRATTIFAGLALLVLPLCTRICGSPDCAIAPAVRAENCTNPVASANDAPQSAVASLRNCGLQQPPSPTLSNK